MKQPILTNETLGYGLHVVYNGKHYTALNHSPGKVELYKNGDKAFIVVRICDVKATDPLEVINSIQEKIQKLNYKTERLILQNNTWSSYYDIHFKQYEVDTVRDHLKKEIKEGQ